MLRSYQNDICVRIADAFRKYRSVMVQMPTGTGKTHVLASLVNEELELNEERRMKSEELKLNEERRVKNEESTVGGRRESQWGSAWSAVALSSARAPLFSAGLEVSSLSFRMTGEGAGSSLLSMTRGREEAKGKSGGILVIAHRRELVVQIEETIRKMLVNFVEDSYSYQALNSNSSFFTLNSSFNSRSSFIRVLSIQWLSKHWEDVKEEPSLVIIDEAHHAVAETYREMWNRWPEARFLGLTATPCRMNRRGFTDLFDTLITSWSIAEFIEKGYLSSFDYVSIRQGSEEQRLIASLEKRGADGDFQIKEMDRVLNRGTSIGRLYRSMEQFAAGKKGIVYAISIDHARRIAEYYSNRGVNAVPIDSKTPAAERKRMVEDFKAGKIQVLVNVDIFSEGFDCPDVEFVQLARPTLSLAKYLQQVGRGLRKVGGKEACVLIDNVGLYRVFGLPTVAWDWEAMFRGDESGRGQLVAEEAGRDWVLSGFPFEGQGQECEMEVIVSHEQLLSDIDRQKNLRPVQVKTGELKAWQDEESGLWGLRRGRNRTTEAQFITVFDIEDDRAAVRFRDKTCGVICESGEVIWKKEGCRSVRFLKNNLLHVQTYNYNKVYYVDLYSLRAYSKKPKVKLYGKVELLEVNGVYYSRTRTVYVNDQGVGKNFIHWRKFYLAIYDERVPYPSYNMERVPSENYLGRACLLDGDSERYYWLYYKLADGSIIVMDYDRKYYYVTEGIPKKYLGCRTSEEEWEQCRAEIERMIRQTEQDWQAYESERAERRLQVLAQSDDAVPFQSGMRWGLKVGNRVTVPPIYRMVRIPVGMYCAVEKNYGQWGVISIDGTVLVEPKYSDIEISMQGVVTGTKVTGSKELMKLP